MPHAFSSEIRPSSGPDWVFDKASRMAEVWGGLCSLRPSRNVTLRAVIVTRPAVRFQVTGLAAALRSSVLRLSVPGWIRQIPLRHENTLAHRVVLPLDPASVAKGVPTRVVVRVFVEGDRIPVGVNLVEHVRSGIRGGADVETDAPRFRAAANRIQAHHFQEFIFPALSHHDKHVDANGAVHRGDARVVRKGGTRVYPSTREHGLRAMRVVT